MLSLFVALCLFLALLALAGYLLGNPGEDVTPSEPLSEQPSEQPSQIPSASQPSIDEHSPSGQGNTAEAQLIERVNALLPQIQCAQCQHPGCRPYAEAIVRDHEPINRCPPGGAATIRDLATLLGRDETPLDADYGSEKPAEVAFVIESECIGCALCIPACPFDAIVGANRQMHVVLEDQCTGCELCLPPCPVDCIEMIPARETLRDWQWPTPA